MSAWISVEDRLPDKAGVYLVKRGSAIIMVARERLFGQAIWNNGGLISNNGIAIIPDEEITYWAELPEPPKEDAK